MESYYDLQMILELNIIPIFLFNSEFKSLYFLMKISMIIHSLNFGNYEICKGHNKYPNRNINPF
jgi:hypothetical protein